MRSHAMAGMEDIRWRDGDPRTAAYACNSCGAHIPEHPQVRCSVERNGGLRPRRKIPAQLAFTCPPVFTAGLEELGKKS